jgi:Rap1a immunity proteins
MASRALVAAALAAVVQLAQAQPDVMARRPAGELLVACEAVPANPGDDTPAATLCLAFVEGFLWGHGWAAWRESRDMHFCPPGEGPVAARTLVPAVVAHLRAHPERLDQPAHLMLFSALSISYPCNVERIEQPADR